MKRKKGKFHIERESMSVDSQVVDEVRCRVFLLHPDSSWQNDPPADLHSCYNVWICSRLSAILWSTGLYFTSPSISLYLPLHPTAEKSLWCLYNPQSSTGWILFFFNIQETPPELCVVYQNEFSLQAATLNCLKSLQLRAKSWQGNIHNDLTHVIWMS